MRFRRYWKPLRTVLPHSDKSVASALWIFAFLLIYPWTGHGATADRTAESSAIMLKIEGISLNSPELLKAIRAQLSATEIAIREVSVPQNRFDLEAPTTGAATVSKRYDAQMVFWILDRDDTCVVSIYISGKPEGSIHTRRLNLASDNHATRFETIANAVSSMLEDTIVAEESTLAQSKSSPQETFRPLPRPATVVQKKYHSELFAAYSGSVFADRTFTHGVQAGLGFLLHSKYVAGIAFTQNSTLTFETNAYRFSVMTRDISAGMARRVVRGPLEFRAGLEWRTSLHSYANESVDGSISIQRPESGAIHSVTPSLSGGWVFKTGFIMILRLGSGIALNEKKYLISRAAAAPDVVLKPYIVKPMLQLGLIIQL
ncbi:MAG: hypothetical protein JXX14_17285 [Deltaproteobacteria bacterium]|nr:hypothetical protein [Deltaproteobacteria bacterium]